MLDKDKVQRLARKAGFENFYQLAQGLEAGGHSCSESQAKRFWNGETDPKLSSLEKLCEALKCRIDEIVSKNGHTKSRSPKRGSGKRRK